MAEDKQIRIGVDASAVRGYEQSQRQMTESIRDGITKLSQESTRSFEKRKRELLEEIALQEKLNKSAYQKRLGIATSDFQDARNAINYTGRSREDISRKTDVAFKTFESEKGSAISSFNEGKQVNNLLRELIETVKQTSKQEIRELGINEEKYVNAGIIEREKNENGNGLSNSANKRGRGEREAGNYGFLRRLGSETSSLVGAGTGLDIFAGGAGMTSNFLESYGNGRGRLRRGSGGGGKLTPDETEAALKEDQNDDVGSGASRALGAIPVIGALLAATIGKGLMSVGHSAQTMETSFGEYAKYNQSVSVRQLQGRDVNMELDINEMAREGLTPAEYFANKAALIGGSKIGENKFGEESQNLMNIWHGTPLSQSDVTGVLGLKRYGGGNVSPEVEYFIKFLKETGQDISVLPEIIQQFTSATTTLVNQTGKAETDRMATLYGGFQSQTGLRGELSSSTFGQIEQGLHRSSNPVIQSMQLRAAREAMGSGATFWDAEKMMASPFSEENKQYLPKFLESIKRVSGGGDNYERALSNIFNINPNIAGKLAKWGGTGSQDELNGILNEKEVSFANRAKNTKGELGYSSKDLESLREVYGTKTAALMSGEMMKMVDTIKKAIDALKPSPTSIIDPNKLMQDRVLPPEELKRREEFSNFLNTFDAQQANVLTELRLIRTQGIKIIVKQ